LATNGELYGVQTDFKSAIKLEFSIPGHSGRIRTKDYPVLLVAAGWDCAAAVLTGLGLVIWKEGHEFIDVTELRLARPAPLEHSIVGLMAAWGFLVCLTEEGFVYRIDGLFDTNLSTTLLKKFVGTQKLTSVSGNFDQFGVFNSAGEVFIGTRLTRSDDSPVVHTSLQGQGIVSLSWGDYHCLALCQDGSVLTWGKINGCLGLGDTDIASARDMNLVLENGYIPTHEPRKLALGDNKFVLKIAAGGWHSGALVVDSNQILSE
jgi:SCF-associated factor 1